MSIDSYIRLFRSRRRLILAVTLGCALLGALVWAVNRPDYEARTEFLVTTGDLPRSFEQAYEGERYAEERMRSYSRILSGPLGAQAIRDELALDESVESIEGRISVAVPPHGVLVDISVEDPSAERAQQMANALGERSQELIDRLETPAGASPLRVTVTRPAETPTGRMAPLYIYVAIGGLLGLLGGFGAARVRDELDERVLAESDARAAVSAPVLGRIGERRADDAPVMWSAPHSADAESYRAMRANLLAVAEEHERRVIAVTSALAGEGKSEVAANIGLAFAQTDVSVVLVDANLHSPRLAGLLDVGSDFGLVDVLTGTLSLDLALTRLRAGTLQVLTGGRPGHDATELLEAEGFGAMLKELADRFDWVIVDAPALLPATDALAVARQAGAAVLVARAGSTDADRLRRAARSLELVESELLGLVLNRVPPAQAAAQRYGQYGAVPRPLAGSGRGDGRRAR